jgi:hypothetical protein
MYVCRCMYAGKERSMRRTKYTRTMDEYEVIIILILCRGGFQPCLQGIYLTNHKLSSVLWPMYVRIGVIIIYPLYMYEYTNSTNWAGTLAETRHTITTLYHNEMEWPQDHWEWVIGGFDWFCTFSFVLCFLRNTLYFLVVYGYRGLWNLVLTCSMFSGKYTLLLVACGYRGLSNLVYE